VLYWDLENPETIQFSKVEPHRNPNLWVVEQGWDDMEFDIDRVPKQLEKAGWWPDVLIVDPLVYATTGVSKENDSVQMARAMRKYTKFARITKRAVIIAHHDRKPPNGQPDDPRWSARGSSALPGAVDVQMNLLIGRHDRRRLQVTFSRYGSTEDHEPTFLLDYDNDTYIVTGKRVFE
jgi:RecA-family ATPase